MAATSRLLPKATTTNRPMTLGNCWSHGREADAVKLCVVDVEQLIDLPEVPGRLR